MKFDSYRRWLANQIAIDTKNERRALRNRDWHLSALIWSHREALRDALKQYHKTVA
jgi:hypothetical protein